MTVRSATRRAPLLPLLALTSVATAAACSGPSQTDAGADATTDIPGAMDAVAHDTQFPDVHVLPPDLDAQYDAAGDDAPDAAGGPAFCSLGTDVRGAVVPADFCLRQFAAPAMLREPRVMAFAPNGDLFVSAPSHFTGAGVTGGPAAIVVLSDDDHDGAAEIAQFATGLDDVHGIAFGPDGLYFTAMGAVWRTGYTPGQRSENAASRTQLATTPGMGFARWTHGLARSAGGALYVTTGVEGASCPDAHVGSIDQVSGGATSQIADGFRNPMYVRCHYRDEVCAVSELGDDGGGMVGAREKVLLVRPDTSYGYPCCSTVDHPASGRAGDCSSAHVTMEESYFPLNDTPFGLDWERGLWPERYRGALFVALHGSFYSDPPWAGAGIVFAATDPLTDAPVGDWQYLVTGFSYDDAPLDRPADVLFGPDGRLFFVDDQGGGVYWVAPRSLRMHTM